MHNIIEVRSADGNLWAREVSRLLPFKAMGAGAFVMAAAPPPGAEPGSFEQRVLGTWVDLVKRIDEGLPPLEYLPESDGMLVRGKRHLIAAPRKEGKSIAMLVHWVRVALAGGQVIILDRENGAELYADRLGAIIDAWDLTRSHKAKLRRNLRYYEFPRLRREDGPALAEMAKNADVVVFDAQRMFLTDWGLDEDDSGDYAQFMVYAIEPLFRAGVATVILDNTGHKERERSRGSSAKGDLNEVLLVLKTQDPFSKHRQGRVQLVLEPGNSRFGNEGTWEMRIGSGAFSPWQRVGQEPPDNLPFRRAAFEALKQAGGQGLSMRRLLEQVRETGVTFGNDAGRSWLYNYAADPDTPVEMFGNEGPGRATMLYWVGP